MKRIAKLFGWMLLVGAALSVLLVLGALAVAGSLAPGAIEINGEPLAFSGLMGGDDLIACGGVLIAMLVAMLVLMLVVPVAVLLPLLVLGLLVGMGLLGAFAVLAGVLTLVFSPLILLVGAVWLIARLARGSGAKKNPPAGATIAP